jgi:hypothetical protein
MALNWAVNSGANAPAKTANAGTTSTPETNLTVFSYIGNNTQWQYQDHTVALSATAIIPPGFYTITTANSNVKVQVTTDGGTTWADLVAANTVAQFNSDGASVRYNNAAGSAQKITVLVGNQSIPAPLTFNS